MRSAFYLLIGLGLALSIEGQAHRDPGVWTEVIRIEDYFQITHQIHLADAIDLLDHLNSSLSVDSPLGQATIALHVEDSFTMQFAEERSIIKTIGVESDNTFLFIYQETKSQPPAAVPSFRLEILDVIFPFSSNIIRYENGAINKLIHKPGGSSEST